eukprot:TRINITY_DN5036_c0_g5_i2.p1 TRINITY_DN5036_c0_g5~~TRINITY_DN5036_c0_g5_i2.p1  ORF type:complete len:427 (+),score=148.83 TRINITY_DN5036_c0_g5_i2:1146-2426(+)
MQTYTHYFSTLASAATPFSCATTFPVFLAPCVGSAAMPAAKRSTTASGAAAAKKLRQSPEEAACHEVSSALRESSLQPAVLEATLAALPHALLVAKESRHRYQEEMVDIFGTLLAERNEHLEAAVRSAESSAATAAAAKEARDTDAQKSQGESEVRKGERQDAKVSLAEVARTFQAAKKVLQDAEAEAARHGRDIVAAGRRKQEAEVLIKYMGHLHEQQEGIKGFLVSLERHLQVDDSLKTAIPCAFAKEPSARGHFDNMTVNQLTERLTSHVAELDAKIAAGDADAAALRAAVDEAQGKLNSVKDDQKAAAREYTSRAAAAATAEAALAAIRKELNQASKLQKETAAAVTEAQVTLELFGQGPLASFRNLRDRTEPPAPEPPAPEQPVPAEPAATEAPSAAEVAPTAEAVAEVAPEAGEGEVAEQ